MRRYLFSLLVAVLATACTSQPASSPTLSANDQAVIATSVAMTVMAENAASSENISTPVVLDTPLPTFTVMAAPVELTSTATSTVQVPTVETVTTAGPCDKVLRVSDAGPLTHVRFRNRTGGKIQLGVFLWQENSYGVCGYLPNNPINIGIAQSYTVNLPAGNYFIWAWITYKNDDTGSVNGNFINNQTSGADTMEVIITKDGVSG